MKIEPLALWVWFRGTRYAGFQTQPGSPTLQAALVEALEGLEAPPSVSPASRTDKGVHARMQVVRVKAPKGDSPTRFAEALARRLPEDIGIYAAVRSPESFHPQWRATGKEYRYRLSPQLTPRGWAPYAWSPRDLFGQVSLERLRGLLERAVGEHDFRAFHESSSPAGPRRISRADVVETANGLWDVRIKGDRFGRYQVRYLVGTAVKVASGALPEAAWNQAIEQGTSIEGFKAPACGLTLWEVFYPPGTDPFSDALRAGAAAALRGPPFSDALGP